MLLILTCSEDATTDMLVPYLNGVPVFRFNIDRYADYSWDFSGKRFCITHMDGQIITSETLRAFYLRKPIFFERIDIPKGGSLVNWAREEVTEVLRDLYYNMEARGKCVLVHPGKGKWRKPRQMALAETIFKVPEWHVYHGALSLPRDGRRWVVKCLTQTLVGEDKTLFVREVDPAKLDPQYPWFVQEKVEADEDVTVVYVQGRMFAFSLKRTSFDGPDYRFAGAVNRLPWRKTDLSADEERDVESFMRTTGFDFGRFDFLRKDGVLWFLEMNPNGQWAWLDEGNQYGLFSAIAEELVHAATR